MAEVLTGLTANDDETETKSGQPVTVDILSNDTLGGAAVSLNDLSGLPEIYEEPSIGSAVVGPDGKITYTPPSGFSGVVEFVYKIQTPDPDPEPQGCFYVTMREDGSIDRYVSNPPPWFIDENFLLLTWETSSGTESNAWFWDTELLRYLPSTGPVPGNACSEPLIGTMDQGSDRDIVDACIRAFCMTGINIHNDTDECYMSFLPIWMHDGPGDQPMIVSNYPCDQQHHSDAWAVVISYDISLGYGQVIERVGNPPEVEETAVMRYSFPSFGCETGEMVWCDTRFLIW